MRSLKILQGELLATKKPWLGASLENVMVSILIKNGFAVKPSFAPSVADLLPPVSFTELPDSSILVCQEEKPCAT